MTEHGPSSPEHKKPSTGLVVSFVVLLLVSILTVMGFGASYFLAQPKPEPEVDPPKSVSIDPAAFEQGRQLFQDNCLLCHGPGGEAKPGLGKDIATSQWVASLSDDELVEYMAEGRSKNDPLNTTGVAMPPRGGNPTLTDEKLRQIVPFIRGIQIKAGTTPN